MASVVTQIEIASSPAQVREVFLDFPKYPEWCRFFTSIKTSPEKSTIEAGDKLTVSMSGMSFSPTVLDNTPSEFKWRGSLWGLLVGDHSFQFEPSKTTSGHTTFSNSEHFSGLVVTLLKPFFGSKKDNGKGFDSFNSQLKERVESRA